MPVNDNSVILCDSVNMESKYNAEVNYFPLSQFMQLRIMLQVSAVTAKIVNINQRIKDECECGVHLESIDNVTSKKVQIIYLKDE